MMNWFGGFLPSWLGFVWPLVLLDLLLKGFALWKSAQAKQKWWFVAILLINSLGILPGVYLILYNQSRPRPHTSR